MPLTNCEINLTLTWSVVNCFLVAGNVVNQVPTFTITDTKLYVPVVTLSIQNNAKLLEQLKSGFKRTINWNKYQSKVSTERPMTKYQSKITTRAPNQHFDYLTDPKIQGVNRLFGLSYVNIRWRTSYKQFFLSTVEIKDYNIMTDRRNFFDQPVKNDLRTYDNIQKFLTGQGDDYKTGCLLDHPYFEKFIN